MAEDNTSPGAEGQNTGHGHVYPRPDGAKARCGGPALCDVCAKDQARKDAETTKWHRRTNGRTGQVTGCDCEHGEDHGDMVVTTIPVKPPLWPAIVAELQSGPARSLTFGGVTCLHTIIPVSFADPDDPERQRMLPAVPMCYEHGPECWMTKAAKAGPEGLTEGRIF